MAHTCRPFFARSTEMPDDLTERELALVDAARGGTVLECGDHGVDVLASSADPGMRVRAAVVRELLLGRCGEVDPRGVQIRGARIVGDLDLAHVTAVARLVLIECVLDRVNLSRTVLPQLVLTGSRAAAINGDGVRVDGDLLLSQTRISGAGAMGALCLPNARIAGILDLQQSEVSNDSGPALHATSLQADGVLLRGARMTGAGDLGSIRLSDAHVRGVLNMDGAEVCNDSGPALHADRLRVDGLLFLREVRLTGRGARGTARLQGARVGGALNLQRAELRNDSGAAVDAADLEVGNNLCLAQMRVSGAGEKGAIRLRGTQVGGLLSMNNTEIVNGSTAPGPPCTPAACPSTATCKSRMHGCPGPESLARSVWRVHASAPTFTWSTPPWTTSPGRPCTLMASMPRTPSRCCKRDCPGPAIAAPSGCGAPTWAGCA
jgi:hypothetical protein